MVMLCLCDKERYGFQDPDGTTHSAKRTISLTAFHAILTTQCHQMNNYKH